MILQHTELQPVNTRRHRGMMAAIQCVAYLDHLGKNEMFIQVFQIEQHPLMA